MNSFIFLFLFSIQGNETAYSVVPQPSVEVCEINGKELTKDSHTAWWVRAGPFNYYQCVALNILRKQFGDNIFDITNIKKYKMCPKYAEIKLN